ncbi:superoxide dismutase [Pacificimonas flava]|uniref:Superoxide dismutase n=1 Tax=Pacificimonas flava TaxID=1234595 RepID=M2U4J6_9SPHN|nr:superoxide dismutase [Pacificimonas flava]EMD82957.1 Superoxide dismutase [Pacificimonas flava]MBB5280117.1 Fe-Mn family superoxide dismutase [Pacificimonas flava]
MAFSLPPLPYDRGALAPHISEETLNYHYGKHHKAYVDKTNAAIEGTDLEGKTLIEVFKAAKQKGDQGLFNNSAQVWNHTFYWHGMTPNGGQPTGDIAAKIDEAFGSFDKFKEEFASKGAGNFASGWTWLVEKDGQLAIVNTDDASNPIAEGTGKPLLTMDVWEHAYYLDRQNARPDYIDHFFQVVNWEFVGECLGKDEADLIPEFN